MNSKHRLTNPFSRFIRTVDCIWIFCITAVLFAAPPALYSKTAIADSQTTLNEPRKGRTLTPVNLREGPSLTDSVLMILEAGVIVDIQAQSGSWLKVKTKRFSGWVSADYVQATSFEKTVDPPQLKKTRRQRKNAPAAAVIQINDAARLPEKNARLAQTPPLGKSSAPAAPSNPESKENIPRSMPPLQTKTA